MSKGMMGAALAALVLMPSIASAQTDVDQDRDIVVSGRLEVPPAEARHYVRQVSSTVGGQLARFADPVCPTVIGLPDAYAGVVVDRIRQVASEAGVRVAPAKCDANIVVIVAADADMLVKGLHKSHPAMFRALDMAELKRALRDGPVHVWNAVQTRNEDGQPMSGNGAGLGGATGGAPILIAKSASIIGVPTQQVTVQSFVVFDDDALLGKTLTQIGDYVAMRTLAGARPPKAAIGTDTILTLFDADGAAPPNLTQVDASYLKGLYASRANVGAVRQLSQISGEIVDSSRERSGID